MTRTAPTYRIAVVALGAAAELVVLVPFALVERGPFVGSLGALPVGIACLAGFLAGPRGGAVVAAAGWAFFFPFVVHWSPYGLFALPLWIGPAVLLGAIAGRLRAREQELALVAADRRYETLRSDLANHAQHELRTPAAVIYGMADVMLKGELDLTAAQTRKFLTLIADSAQRLTNVPERLEQLEPSATP
jgi:signal transduction histidine kinase